MNLPSLALPPIGGLLVLLFGYVVLVGPVNYVVLRRIDRREWAWITVPVLIVVFTVGSFGIGGLLRGSDVIVHEVGIVRGAPGVASATIQSYLGHLQPVPDDLPGAGPRRRAPVATDERRHLRHRRRHRARRPAG